MRKDEDIKTFQKKRDLIYDACAKIRNESEQAIKLIAELYFTYAHKHDSGVDLNLAEKQAAFLLEEANKIYEKIDQNRKKLAELIKVNDTPPKPPLVVDNKITEPEQFLFESVQLGTLPQ